MNLLLLGSSYFQQALIHLGHDVAWAGTGDECDIRLSGHQPELPRLLSEMDRRPDAVILTDDLGRRVLPWGLEKVEIPLVWYAVDSPINLYWQKHYVHLFDLVLVDQNRQARELAALSPPGRVHWLPVGVDTAVYVGAEEDKRCDIGFVGVVDERVRPKRSRIIEALARRHHLVSAGGRQGKWVTPTEAARLYRQSRLVLNENLFAGVTTRMLEAMASGAALLTEDGGNGLGELFEPDRDLAVYGPHNLLDQAERLLRDAEARKRLARNGRDKVSAGHDIRHRAEGLIGLIDGLEHRDRGNPSRASGEQAKAFLLTGLRWPHHDGPERVRQAESGLRRADASGVLDPEGLFYLGLAAKVRGTEDRARPYWKRAAERGDLRALLALAVLDLEKGRAGEALKWVRQAGERTETPVPSDLFGRRPPAERHLVFGDILLAAGHSLTPGFVRLNLDLSTWNAFEHYRRAVSLAPELAAANLRLGRLLAAHDAHVEAYPFLDRAARAVPDRDEAAAEAERSARLGYLRLDSAGEAAA